VALLPSRAPAQPDPTDDSLLRVLSKGHVDYGCDPEGGGPYAFPDPDDPGQFTGFEVDLMRLLCGPIGPRPVLVPGLWDTLLQTLDARRVDVVVNGYELTPPRVAQYLATRPYYVYQLQLMARPDSGIIGFDALKRPRPAGRKWSVAVLGNSAADFFAREHGAATIDVLSFNGATDAMMAVANGQADATLQDIPAARFYAKQFATLSAVGPPLGEGYYVIYLRRGERALQEALNAAIARSIANGELKALYDRYGIWTEAQERLASLGPPAEPSDVDVADQTRGLPLLARYSNTLLASAGMTVLLSLTSMPLAIVIGLAVALGRLYGPTPLRSLLTGYVELIRGTPLMLQLYVIFFMFPQFGISLHPLVAGIGGLAINYSAYEAEIYRAGLQAIPSGQMEAALCLGMTRRQALRRVVVPQALRIVIPPVTNDFIALFKDTSVCSAISIIELTKRYQILANSTGGVVEFAVATAALYMLMSLPLTHVARAAERRMGADPGKGVIA
jgi:polar amino acid transport system substrate-binding protein